MDEVGKLAEGMTLDLHLGNNNYLVNMEHQRRGKTTAGTELSQSTAFSKKTTSWRKIGRKKKL